MPKISIIVPVYNTAKYLERCIDSIIAQTYADWELLLIDDGSTDHSGDICDRYAASDPRIQAFHKPNGGVSSARNLGLDHAKGEWITFVDSDDYIESRFLESFSGNIDADLIIGNAQIIGNVKVYDLNYLPTGEIKELDSILKQYLSLLPFNAPWAKLYSSKIIGNIRFDRNFKIGEDALFNLKILKMVKNLRILPHEFINNKYIYKTPSEGYDTKYQLSVNSAISQLLTMNEAYEQLNIKSEIFENSLVYAYYERCVNDIPKNGKNWYKNKEIRQLCLRRASNIGKFQYLKTWLVFSLLYPIKMKLAKKHAY